MNNVSFGAKFTGMDTPEILNVVFEIKTQNDKKHTVLFVKRSDYLEQDKFELYTNDKKTAEYETQVDNEKLFSIQRLLGIYNILKAKEARNKVNELKKQHK